MYVSRFQNQREFVFFWVFLLRLLPFLDNLSSIVKAEIETSEVKVNLG